ncbi:hypothetical protein AGMMS49938_13620 [Fibrobacterales bacterium]|nr:hypothetical protein AGMMS49938_13620 [Fibrobacterales bacterium]
MKYHYSIAALLLFLFSFCFSQMEISKNSIDSQFSKTGVFRNEDSLEFLSPDQFLNSVLRRELAIKNSENTEDSLSKELLGAAVFYYDKKWDSAFAAYKPLLEKVSDFLYGSIALRLAKCELEMGNYAEVRKILLDFRSIKNNRTSWENSDKLILESILRDTTAIYSASQTPATIKKAKIDSINVRIKSNPSSAYLKYLKEQLAKLTGKKEILDEYDEATKACKISGDANKCAELVTALLSNKKAKIDSAKKINLRVLLADAYKQQGKTENAIRIYKNLLDSVDYNSAWMQNLLRLLRNSGNKKEAKRLDSLFQKKFPFSVENANNIWVRALEYEQNGEFDKAAEAYKQLCNPKFGKNQRRAWAKFRIGFIKLKDKKYEDAIPFFAESAAENLNLMSRSASLYFYAESQKLLGNNDKARDGFFEVINDFPLGYYAWRARQKLAEYEFASENEIPKIIAEIPADSVHSWLVSLEKKNANGKDTLVSTERLKQISILLHSGFEEEAFSFYEEALKFHKNRPEFYYLYGKMFLDCGEYALAYKMARTFLDIVPRQKMNSVPIAVMKFLYPIPHETKIRVHTGENIDPFFVYSIMRQESSFDTKIQSAAGARGLLQIMPATGSTLANLEKIQGFNKDLLFNPYMNIRLGIRYMRDLFSEHSGDYIGILGEYNAGPAPAKRWLSNYGTLPWDIRVEEVSYWETRDYVKRVMGNYWTYKEVYSRL